MLKISVICLLVAVAFVLIRYGTNEKLQKFVIAIVSGGLLTYIIFVIGAELFR